MNTFLLRGLVALLALLVLCQCDTTKSDLEAIARQNEVIAREEGSGYYVGRRYYIPGTRFWGYVRPPRAPWAKARLVIMDESKLHTPDRGAETGDQAVYGKDKNCEYKIYGHFTNREAYDPNSNQKLPVFKLTGYQLTTRKPGWLFKPSERYSTKAVTLRPSIIPRPLPDEDEN